MKIRISDLSFAYNDNFIFKNFNADIDDAALPLVILGPSGSGKTTLLKLLGGILKPQAGNILYSGGEPGLATFEWSGEAAPSGEDTVPKASFVFQEPRLLPWLTVLENVRLPLERDFGMEDARKKAMDFLSLVSLQNKENALPGELSGGEAQRVSMARAFAWPAPLLLMDEPFQSLDLPLRMSLMDLALSLLKKEKHFLVAVTHDPGEAVYLGGRIIVLGKAGAGIVFDKTVNLPINDRAYGSLASRELEKEIFAALKENPNSV